ncbi:hypothetical protein B566_EDAN013485 [Ephemera danica]|nr:hypothetical protein B566_EDAN013485 [Ephemera danica]
MNKENSISSTISRLVTMFVPATVSRYHTYLSLCNCPIQASPSGKAARMDDISDVRYTPMTESSPFVKPYHMYFKQGGRQRRWDLLKIHNSVAILIYNVSREVIVLVKQFRPAVYVSNICEGDKEDGQQIDTGKYPASIGFTLELCAGIVDKPSKSLEEIALLNFFLRSGIGITGDKQTVFYAEVTDDMKTSKGGGNEEEGELIEVVELPLTQAKAYITQKDVCSPGGFLFALHWFFNHKNITL